MSIKHSQHRVAVVGCGALARMMHLPNIVKNPRAKLAAVCDRDPKIANECKNKYGAESSHTDWRPIVDAKNIDLIVLATHTNLRAELIVPALHSGKAVYTEKPLAASEEEMIRILEATKQSTTPVCVGHNRRSSPAMLEFKRLVEKTSTRSASAPTMDRSSDRNSIPEQKWKQLLIRINDDVRSWKDWVLEDQQGILFAEMVHFVDIALWLMKSPPVRIFVEGSTRGNFTAVITFADGSMTTMQHTMVGHFDYPKELFEFTAGNFTVAMAQHIEIRQSGFDNEPAIKVLPYSQECTWATELGFSGFLRESETERKRAIAENRAPRWLNVNKGHYEHLDRFITHIEGKGPNPCDADSAVTVSSLTLKLLESARQHKPINLSTFR